MRKYVFLILLSTCTVVFAQDGAKSDTMHILKIVYSLNADAYMRVSSNQSSAFSSPAFKHNKPGIGWINPKLEFSYKNLKIVSDMAYGERQAAFYAFIDTVWHSYFKELYLEYTLAEKLHIALGAYTTHFNFEYNEPGKNCIYTPSFIYTYIPATYSGLRLTYDIKDNWTAMLGIYNDFGIDRFSFNKIRHIAANVAYVSDTKNLAVNFITGNDIITNDVLSFEVYADYNFTPKFNLGADLQYYKGTYVDAVDSQNWTAFATYARYDFTNKWSLGGRAEWFLDKYGFAFGEPENDVLGYTLCGKYKLEKYHTQFVLEYRHDSSKVPLFENLTTVRPFTNNQDQATLGIIYQF
jgi:Putative beta-barrel porin-2, OmpL-like. bbp2